MVLLMARPMKRPASSFHQFRQRIPADILARARGLALLVPVGASHVPLTISATAAAVQVSLRTRDPREAKARQGILGAHLEQVWQGLRDGPARLSHKQVVALAGEVYAAWTSALEDDPGTPAMWEGVMVTNALVQRGKFGRAALMLGDDAKRQQAMEERFSPFVDWCLARHALAIDAETRERLVVAVGEAMDGAAVSLSRKAAGDYRPDPLAARFPPWQASPTAAPAVPNVSLSGLLAGWWTEAKGRNLSLSTYESYSATVAKLGAFVEHDDAARLTPDDVIRFKDFRLATVSPRTGKLLSAATVKDNDLAGLKAVFGWAVANRKLSTNPAAGITVRAGKRIITRPKGLSEAEAHALLAASFAYVSKRERPKMIAAKRWVPWLCAYTGARVGEMVQLRRQDVRLEAGVWVVNITPEAGTVKTSEARMVALHPHLIATGFVAFAQSAPSGYLFLKVAKDADWRGAWRGVKNRLQEFARETVKDPGVAPNHGWRHRFKTVGRSVGIDPALLDRITGHAPASVGDAYGDYALDVQFKAISRMPAYPTALPPSTGPLDYS